MAGTHKALLVIVFVGLTGVWQGTVVQSQLCQPMEICTDDFQEKASQYGYDQEKYCQLLKELLECYNTVKRSCSAELGLSVQSKISAAQSEQKRAKCGAKWIEASHWLLTVSTILALFFHRRA